MWFHLEYYRCHPNSWSGITFWLALDYILSLLSIFSFYPYKLRIYIIVSSFFTQALDAKVLIFKKKRRKNYRRTKGHRQVCSEVPWLNSCNAFVLIHLSHFFFLQELTKLRIIDIQGIEKPEPVVTEKPSKAPGKKPEKVAVAS